MTGSPAVTMPRATERVGRFQLIRPLEYGGCGETFEAFDPLFGQTIALKLLPRRTAHEPDLCALAWQWASVCHESIMAVHDAGLIDDLVFIAMPRVEARPLSSSLAARTPVPAGMALPLLSQILAALQAAHQGDLVHGALQPSNILCSASGDVMVSDFGLPDPVTDYFLNPPYYQSPEQLWSDGVDYRTDIYSAGVIAYEMLTGVNPFASERNDVSTVMIKIMSGQKPPLIDSCLSEHPALAGVLAKAMARRPEDRFQSVRELSAALTSAIVHPV